MIVPSAGTRATGTHEHHVAELERIDANDGEAAAIVDAFGFVGQELGERRERCLRLPEGLHFQPVAEQHDRDESGRAPTRTRGRTIRCVVASDAAYATLIAIATSSIIPGWRCWISAHAPDRNTQPHQKKITEPRTGPIQSMPVKSSSVAEPVHDHRAGDDDRDG